MLNTVKMAVKISSSLVVRLRCGASGSAPEVPLRLDRWSAAYTWPVICIWSEYYCVYAFVYAVYRVFSLTWPASMQIVGTKESVCIRKEFNSHRIG